MSVITGAIGIWGLVAGWRERRRKAAEARKAGKIEELAWGLRDYAAAVRAGNHSQELYLPTFALKAELMDHEDKFHDVIRFMEQAGWARKVPIGDLWSIV